MVKSLCRICACASLFYLFFFVGSVGLSGSRAGGRASGRRSAGAGRGALRGVGVAGADTSGSADFGSVHRYALLDHLGHAVVAVDVLKLLHLKYRTKLLNPIPFNICLE